MTNESKKNAIQYLIGKLNETPSTNNIEFNEYNSITNEMQTDMATYFPYGYNLKGIVQGNSSSGDGLEYSVLFGNYQNQAQTLTRGFIIILDEKYNIVQVIKQYTNEEYFGDIMALNVGNDGRFFMTELDGNGYYRFVLLNNILVKSPAEEDYQVIQRQTYRFPDQTIINNNDVMIINKHPQDARYLITQVYRNYPESTLDDTFFAIEFVINVGSENEWNVYSYDLGTITLDPTFDKVNDVLVSWDEENKLTFKAILSEPAMLYTIVREIFKLPTSDTLIYNNRIVEYSSGYNQFDFTQAINKNFTTSYLTTSKNDNGDITYKIYKITNDENPVDGDLLTPDLIATYDNITAGTFIGIRLAKNQNDIFCVYQDTETYVGIIVGNNVYLSTFSGFSSLSTDTLFYTSVQRTYNLYTLYVQCGDKINFAKLIYVDETNNQPYVDVTCLTPYYGTLYDENGKLIYARTLYNKSVSGNLTTSSIQVPNQFLNNISIEGEKLFGQTYIELYDNSETFQKNEYEEVYVNFANTWYIQNQNDINNIIFNTPGAIRFNQSITSINDYTLAQAVKYRINYDDATSSIIAFESNQITQIDNVAPWTHRYSWAVYNPTDKSISSIDIISNDETTTYQSITNLNFASGQIYTLTQDVYVV